jgi:hypothetical protein
MPSHGGRKVLAFVRLRTGAQQHLQANIIKFGAESQIRTVIGGATHLGLVYGPF